MNWGDPTTLIAYSKEPLQVELPLLGYTLYADVVEARSNMQSSSRTGYYYFVSYEGLNSRQKKLIQKNRRLAYYNSSIHFLRSLYEGTLKKQGFLVLESKVNDQSGNVEEVEVDLTKYLQSNGEEKILNGLKSHRYAIWYIHNNKGEPHDISKKNKRAYRKSMSAAYIMSDSCIIRPDGTTPNLSVRFSGDISNKRVGAGLPSDYDPNEGELRGELLLR